MLSAKSAGPATGIGCPLLLRIYCAKHVFDVLRTSMQLRPDVFVVLVGGRREGGEGGVVAVMRTVVYVAAVIFARLPRGGKKK